MNSLQQAKEIVKILNEKKGLDINLIKIKDISITKSRPY